MVWCENGSPKSSIGLNLWTVGNVYAGGNVYEGGTALSSNYAQGGMKIIVSATATTSPSTCDIWIDTSA